VSLLLRQLADSEAERCEPPSLSTSLKLCRSKKASEAERCEGKGVYFPVDIVLNGEEWKAFEDVKSRGIRR